MATRAHNPGMGQKHKHIGTQSPSEHMTQDALIYVNVCIHEQVKTTLSQNPCLHFFYIPTP